MQPHWKFYPALKLLLPFSAGIILSASAPVPSGPVLLALAFSLAWFGIRVRSDHHSAVLPLCLVLFCSGALSYCVHSHRPFEGLHGIRIPGVEAIGRLAAEPVVRDGSVLLLLECDSVLYRNSVLHLHQGRIRVRFFGLNQPGELPRYGDHLSLTGTLGVLQDRAAPGQGEELIITGGSLREIWKFQRDDLSLSERLVVPIREAARNFASAYVGSEQGDIVRALLIGERDYLDESTRAEFIRAGTVHILAVSGQHVGIIALALFMLVSWIRSRTAQFIVYAILLCMYGLAAGGGSSITRAVLMGVGVMLARLAGHIQRPVNTLAFAALVILLADPRQLFTPGFQLSFASVAGIVLLYRPMLEVLTDRFPRTTRMAVFRPVLQVLLLSISAQVFTIPLSLHYFGYVSMVGLVLNVAAVPIGSVALGSGVAGTVAASLSPVLASWFGGSAYMATTALEWLVKFGSGLPVAGISPGAIGWWATVVLTAGIIFILLARHPFQAVVRVLLVLLAVVLAVDAEHRTDSLRRPNLCLYCLDVAGSPLVSVRKGDTLTWYGTGIVISDSTALRRYPGTDLADRTGVRVMRFCNLDSVTADGNPAYGVVPSGAGSQDYYLRDIPVILTKRRCPLALLPSKPVMLQIPMAARFDETIVLSYNGRFERISWH